MQVLTQNSIVCQLYAHTYLPKDRQVYPGSVLMPSSRNQKWIADLSRNLLKQKPELK